MNYVNLLDIIYPVNSIYMSLSDESPSEFIGGIWYKLESTKYLMSTGDDIPAGTLGGTNSVALTIAQMPTHSHTITTGIMARVDGINQSEAEMNNATWIQRGWSGSTFNTKPNAANWCINTNGSSEPHTNMPEYYAINIWIRIA